MSGLFSPQLFEGRTVLITNAGDWARPLADAFSRGGAKVKLAADEAAIDTPAIAETFDAAEMELGPVDILINGPAPRAEGGAEDITLADWRAVTAPGYDGVFLRCAEFARRRIAAEGRGWVVNLMETPGPAGHAAGIAAAAGVANLVKTLGAEWARDGIRVNGLSARDWSGASEQSLVAMTLYLCSPYSGFVTASLLEIDSDA